MWCRSYLNLLPRPCLQNQLLWWLQATKPALSPLVAGRAVTPSHCRRVISTRRNFKPSQWVGRQPLLKLCTWCSRLANSQSARRLSWWRVNTSWKGQFYLVCLPRNEQLDCSLGKRRDSLFPPCIFRECWINFQDPKVKVIKSLNTVKLSTYFGFVAWVSWDELISKLS